MKAPTTEQLVAAAERTARTKPRPGLLYFRLIALALLRAAGPTAAITVLDRRRPPGVGSLGTLRAWIEDAARSEAELRGIVVELALACGADRLDERWPEALGLDEEASR